MLKEECISFEQAKKLKELKFPQEPFVNDYQTYYDEGICSCTYERFAKVPQSLIVKWLREEKYINIWVSGANIKTEYPYTWHLSSDWNLEEEDDEIPYIHSEEWFKSYEDALTCAINKALEILKNKQ